MRPNPKPAPAAPKAKKPLARGKSVIAKTKARARKRTYKTPRCLYATPTGRHPCKKPQEVTWHDPGSTLVSAERIIIGPGAFNGMCRSHAKLEAHARVRAFVRQRDGGRCVIPHQHILPCGGAWQPNHGFDRDNKAATWAEWNVMGGCAAINTWAHHNHLRWFDILQRMWGDELYEERRLIALRGEPMSVADVLAKYPPEPRREKNEEAA